MAFTTVGATASGGASLAHTNSSTDDILVVWAGDTSATPALSGGGVTTWNTLDLSAAQGALFWGVITATGSQTITSSTAYELVAQEFNAGSGGTYSADGAGGTNSGSTSTANYPSLIPSATGELYIGWMVSSNNGGAGSSTGFAYVVSPNSNVACWSLNAPNPSAPTCGNSGSYWTNGQLVKFTAGGATASFVADRAKPRTRTVRLSRPRPGLYVPAQIPVPPTRPQATHPAGRRIAAIARGHKYEPPWPPPPNPSIVLPARPPRKLAAFLRRGRQTFPVQAQIPVPATRPQTVKPAGRRIAALVKGRKTEPPWGQQAAPANPLFVSGARPPKRLYAALRRGRQLFPVQPQTTVPPTIPSSTRPAGRRWTPAARGRQVFPVQPQIAVPAPVWPTETPASRRRLFALHPRGRQTFPVQPQTPVPATLPSVTRPAGRRLAALVRGRKTEPPWGQQAAPPNPSIVLPARPPRKLAAFLRRGHYNTPVPAQVTVPTKRPTAGIPGSRGRQLYGQPRGRRTTIYQILVGIPQGLAGLVSPAARQARNSPTAANAQTAPGSTTGQTSPASAAAQINPTEKGGTA